MPRSSGVIALVLTLIVALAAASAAAAGNGHGAGPNEPVRPDTDVKVKAPKDKRNVPGLDAAAPAVTAVSAATATTPLGTVRTYVLVNYVTNGIFGSAFTLKGVGEHSEVWVQNNTTFPAGDCRNDDASRLAVTQEQIDYFVHEFDTTIWPRESEVFSVAPPNDGTESTAAQQFFGNPDYFVGDGNRTVILVMNIRDSNYYARTTRTGSATSSASTTAPSATTPTGTSSRSTRTTGSTGSARTRRTTRCRATRASPRPRSRS